MAFNQTIAQLAMASYGRALARSGMDFYDNLLTTGVKTQDEILNEFMSNTEAMLRYPTSQSNEDTVKQIFNNILGRDPATQTGIDHYSNLLATNTWSQADLIAQILEDATKNDGGDSNYLSSRVDVAYNSYYTLGDLSNSSTYGVLALDSKEHWDNTNGVVTYSFNSTIPVEYYDYNEYAGDSVLTNGWVALNAAQKNAVRDITLEINKLLGIKLEEVSSGGMIQLNMVTMDDNTSGFAFVPGTDYDYDGDVFLTTKFNSTDEYGLGVGEEGWLTMVHEIGHALGLKHPFEGENTLAEDIDNINHSIMSYTYPNSYIPVLSFSSSKIFIDYTKIYPDLYSLYDIAALQSIYGVNTTTNITDDTYNLKYTDYKIQTIWDAGGIDTIDLTDTIGDTTLDLSGGSLNSVDQYSLSDVIDMHQDIAAQNGKSEHNAWIAENITALYESNNLYTGINNFAIATGVIIENINTGSGDDNITDNEVNNIINTNGGNDKIYIKNGGKDIVDGGDGEDTLYLNIDKKDISTNVISDTYTIKSNNLEVSFTNIEYIVLNGISYTPDYI